MTETVAVFNPVGFFIYLFIFLLFGFSRSTGRAPVSRARYWCTGGQSSAVTSREGVMKRRKLTFGGEQRGF